MADADHVDRRRYAGFARVAFKNPEIKSHLLHRDRIPRCIYLQKLVLGTANVDDIFLVLYHRSLPDRKLDLPSPPRTLCGCALSRAKTPSRSRRMRQRAERGVFIGRMPATETKRQRSRGAAQSTGKRKCKNTEPLEARAPESGKRCFYRANAGDRDEAAAESRCGSKQQLRFIH